MPVTDDQRKHLAADGLVPRLQRLADERPLDPAYTWVNPDGDEAVLRFGELAARAGAVASAARAAGSKGPAILFFGPGLEHVAGLIGCLAAGVTAVSAHGPSLGGPERSRRALDALTQRTGAGLVVSTVALRERIATAGDGPHWLAVDELPGDVAALHGPAPAPDAPALLQFTSGSTARAKAVVLTAAAVQATVAQVSEHCALDSDDTLVSWLPLYHDLGLMGALLPAWQGSHDVLLSPLSFLQRPARWLAAASAHRGTIIAAPNFGFELCARRVTYEQREALDLRSVELAVWGAEPARPATIDRFLRAFAPCGLRETTALNGYGMAEFGCHVASQRRGAGVRVSGFDAGGLERGRAVASDHPDARRLASAGTAAEGAELRVVDSETGRTLAADEIGEIWVAGPSCGSGYADDPDATAAAFGARTAEGDGPFLRTGDLGFTHRGEVYVCGRRKDVVIVRGRNLMPQDVEDAAAGADARLAPNSTIAFGLEDGAQEALVVVQEVEVSGELDLEALPARIAAAVGTVLGVRPDRVVLVARGRLPRAAAGKVSRRPCRSAFLAGELPVLLDRELGA